MIHVENLTKAYGDTRAVDDLSFEVRPGIVTGFLGPNGAGKSTTMRMILGLDRPTSGRATVNGRVLTDHPAPITQIGSLLEATPGPTALPATLLDVLTAREREVMGLAALGLSNDEIAERLYLSPLTAKTHANRAMMKLNVRDRAQLVVLAYQTGLVTP